MSRTRLLPRLENLPGLPNLRKDHLPGWFFRFQSKRLRAEKKDLKKILFLLANCKDKIIEILYFPFFLFLSDFNNWVTRPGVTPKVSATRA